MRSEMKTLMEIWKRLLNEAGNPVSDIIDELKKTLSLNWEEDKTPKFGHFARCPVVRFHIVVLRIR